MTQSAARADAVISLQGNIIRSRVPTAILQAAGGDDGDAINWVVNGQGLIVGKVVKGGAAAVNANRTMPVPKNRQPGATTKAAAPKPAKKGQTNDLDALFGAAQEDEEDWGDDAPLPKVKAPAVKKAAPAVSTPKVTPRPVPTVVGKKAAPAPVAAPKTKAPILKPSQATKGSTKGKVRYEVPGEE